LTTVHVSFPVLRGTSRLFVQKGRRWSVIEHLLLDAVTREPGSAADFAAKSGLPRCVIVEVFIRLMRAGWVEINVVQSRLVFRATALGMVQAPLDQLPAATVTQPKKRSYAIEQITGGVFRSRELDVRPSYRLPEPRMISWYFSFSAHSFRPMVTSAMYSPRSRVRMS
jgi:cardiolipin synthase